MGRGFYSTFHLRMRRSHCRATPRLRGSYSGTQVGILPCTLGSLLVLKVTVGMYYLCRGGGEEPGIKRSKCKKQKVLNLTSEGGTGGKGKDPMNEWRGSI